MVAVMQMDRRYEQLERRALEGELNRWGKWIERHSDYEGYPRANILIAFLHGRGGGAAGHRILCLDMPTDVYSVHHRVLRCTEEEQEAIWAWYVIRVKDDGTVWGLSEKSEKMGLEAEELRRRVNAAKQRILGLCLPACVREEHALSAER